MREAELLFIKSCEASNLEKVHAYLTLAQDLDIDINAVEDKGRSAARLAAWKGHTEVIRVLAATGRVDWNKAGLNGFTPLHRALIRGHLEIARIIMKQDNIDLRLKTNYGWTLAMAAVTGRNASCVEFLAEQENFDCWNIPDDDGNTPLMKSIEFRNNKILQVLLNCPRVDPI